MELPSDFIEKNQHFLKSCILYEMLQKKPIFDSYRNFCDTVGKDAMEYPDFEFWYYRFYHGDRDFDYDRSEDPEPKTLVDMPVVLMTKITRYLDPVERTLLRSMNHSIKTVVDSFPPVFDKIDITFSDDDLIWTLNNKHFSCYRDYAISEPNSSEAEESDENYMKKGIENLASVLRMPNLQVNHLSLKLFVETPSLNDLLSVSLNAKSVYICSGNTISVVQVLSAMTPGYLESICLDGLYSEEIEAYSLIFETDQFKQAKNVEFLEYLEPTEFNVEELLYFSHLKKFKCHVKCENTFEDVPRIRDTISTFDKFESCELIYQGVFDNPAIVAFAMALGEEIPNGPLPQGESLTFTHLYQIPESNECLEFNLESLGYYRCRINIVKIR